MTESVTLAARAAKLLPVRAAMSIFKRTNKEEKMDTRSLAIRAANIISASENPQVTDEKKSPHKKARDDAQAIYEAAAIAAAAKAQEKKKKREREEEIAAILLLLLLAGEDAYQKTYSTLGTDGLKNADEIQIQEQAKTFAASRQDDLEEFSGKLADALELTKSESSEEKLTGEQIARALRDTAKKVSTVMVQTEAQCTYGAVQIDRLARAGFKTKIWMTMEDEKVRPTHVECGEQGAIALDKPFANGLKFPGDPNGGASEICNCRCWLIGGSR